MAKVFNRNHQKNLRKSFRNNPTRAEAMVWSALKDKQLSGFKFRRQQGVGPYVLDFYCPLAKLGIEIDGETHWTVKEKLRDHRKENFVRKFGVQLMRFTNTDVYDNLEGVLAEIEETASQRTSTIRDSQ